MPSLKLKDILLFENEDFIVVNKPPFIATMEDRVSPINMYQLVKEHGTSAMLCHRLDKETSGALAFAKNQIAHKALNQQFEKRIVTKKYHAIAEGIHRFENSSVNLPILTLSKGLVKISQSGKESQTIFQTLEVFNHYTLVECKPVTGRMHQIRIHLSAQNAPIAGDESYGGHPFYLSKIKRNYNLKKFTEEEPLIKRTALHAQALSFELLNAEKIAVEAPYPKDFRAVLNQLRKHG